MKETKRSAGEVPETPPLLYRLIISFSGFHIAGALLPVVLYLCSGKLFLSSGTALLISSVLSLLFYRTDKTLAEQGMFRIPERNLLLWGLFWGWPGALLAQRIFRHKNRKVFFQIIFWFSVLLNGGIIFLTIWCAGELNELRNRVAALFGGF